MVNRTNIDRKMCDVDETYCVVSSCKTEIWLTAEIITAIFMTNASIDMTMIIDSSVALNACQMPKFIIRIALL